MKEVTAVTLSHGVTRRAGLLPSGLPRRFALIICAAVLGMATCCLLALPGATPAKAAATPAKAPAPGGDAVTASAPANLSKDAAVSPATKAAAQPALTGDLQVAINSTGTFIATIQNSTDTLVNYWYSGGFWHGPAGIGGTSRSDSPVAIDDNGGEVVFINASGAVVEDTRNASTGTWTGPTAIGGTAAAGSPLAISGNGSTVAFLNSSDAVVVDTLSGSTWSGPTATGGTARSNSPIAIDDNASNIYFIDTGSYVTNDWASGSGWAGPSRMGGQAGSQSQIATNPGGNIVAYVNSSGAVVNDWVNSSGTWSGPAGMGGTAEANSPLALNGTPTNVYFLNTSGNVVNDYVSNGAWIGPAGIGGTAVSGSGLATVTSSSAEPQVVYLSSLGVSEDWHTAGGWHGPSTPNLIPTNLRGMNWPAGTGGGGNYSTGNLVINGLSTSDTTAQAESAGQTITSNLYSASGANTVRIPINEATVSGSYWPVYEAAINGMRANGNVIITYWAYQNGEPANMTNYWAMWKKVVGDFGGDSDVFFEPINEPYAYSASSLVADIYNPWLSNYSSVPRQRVILDGTGYAQNAAAVGSLVSGTLLAVHDYTWFASGTLTEAQWESHLSGEIGGYGYRTVMTEFGGDVTLGYNYDATSTDDAVTYFRGLTDEARALGIGSVYWPGISISGGDPYRLYTLSGTSLTLTNQSALDRVHYGWAS